jgi:hypothetical protein
MTQVIQQNISSLENNIPRVPPMEGGPITPPGVEPRLPICYLLGCLSPISYILYHKSSIQHPMCCSYVVPTLRWAHLNLSLLMYGVELREVEL